MFTGIIETLGLVKGRKEIAGNVELEVESQIAGELKPDQSVSHNGACLTVTRVEEKAFYVTVIEETLKKTTLGKLKVGDFVNLERAMLAQGRFDGHMVLGHVDGVGSCISLEFMEGSHIFTFEHKKILDYFTIEKGSICVNGISLTVVNSKPTEFSVAIIPYTFEHTNLKDVKKGDKVNLEFDVLGKYIKRMLERQK